MSNMRQAMAEAIHDAAATEADALEIIAQHSGCAVIKQYEPIEEFVLSCRYDKRAATTTKVLIDEVEYMPHDEAANILHSLGTVRHSISRAVNSLIADYLIDRADIVLAVFGNPDEKAANKSWKEIKAGAERQISPDGSLHFPQQWENYFSLVKAAGRLGKNPMTLKWQAGATVRVASEAALRAFIKERKPATVKRTNVERAGAAIDTIIDLAESDDGLSLGSSDLSALQQEMIVQLAKVLPMPMRIEIAEQQLPEPAEIVRNLLDDGHAAMMRQMLDAYEALEGARHAA